MRNLTLAVAFAALWTLSGCKKTGEGQYEVQKPVVGTQTDTVNTPTIETGTVKDTITVPTVGTEKKEVTLAQGRGQEAQAVSSPSRKPRDILRTPAGSIVPAGLYFSRAPESA